MGPWRSFKRKSACESEQLDLDAKPSQAYPKDSINYVFWKLNVLVIVTGFTDRCIMFSIESIRALLTRPVDRVQGWCTPPLKNSFVKRFDTNV